MGIISEIKNIYCDMDGVLADFNAEPDGVNRFKTEKGFFKNLKPLKRNVKALKKMIADGYNVFILSASPNKEADGDKVAWLEQYLPEIKAENIIIIRNGEKKVDYMKTPDGILFDDYGKNLREWTADGKENKGSFKIKADGDINMARQLFALIG